MRDIVVADVSGRAAAAFNPECPYGGHQPSASLTQSPSRWIAELEVLLLELHRSETKLADTVEFWSSKGLHPDEDWSVFQRLIEVRHDIMWADIRLSEVRRRRGFDTSDHYYVRFLKAAIEEHRHRKCLPDAVDKALWSALDGQFDF